MLKKSTFRKAIALLMAIAMIVGACPAAVTAAAETGAAGNPGSYAFSPGPADARVDAPESWFDELGEAYSGAELLPGYYGEGRQMKTVAAERGENADEADSYLSALAETLQQPVGAQGFDDGFDTAPDAMVEIVVQFTTLPSEALKLYNRQKGVNMTQGQAKFAAKAAHDRFISSLLGLTASARISGKIESMSEHSQLFNGVLLRVPAGMVEQIAALPEVYCVTPNVTYRALDGYADFDGGGMAEARDLFDMTYIYDTLGYTGEGVTVAVLDTGIDYNHPDLAGAYKGGWDFVDNDSSPMETTYKDWQEANRMSPGGYPEHNGIEYYYTSHGTHVSGSIAARGASDAPNAALGMAPEADLLVYRVLGPYGQGDFSTVMNGIERAYQDGADVMNLSLGAPHQEIYSPEAFALNVAVLNGVVVCLAAGNEGQSPFTLGTPSLASLPITVGAGLSGGLGASGYAAAAVDGNALEINLLGWKPGDGFGDDSIDADTGLERLEDGSYLYAMVPGYGEPGDFTAAGDLSGKIAVVYRGGGIDFTVKRDRAAAAGAGAMILVNNDGGNRLNNVSLEGEQTGNVIPVFTVRQTEGGFLAEGSGTVKLGVFSPSLPADDGMADFSSAGPVHTTWQIKPDIVAPGFNILSTAPNYMNNAGHSDDGGWENAYQRMSGTSMASPHMAGIAALMVQKFGHEPTEIKSRLMNTARPLEAESFSVYQIGAGFVRPKEALESKVYATIEHKVPWLDAGGDRMLQSVRQPSLNFGVIEGAQSGGLTVTLHGDVTGLTYDVAYYDGGFFSASCQDNGVTLDVSGSEDTYAVKLLIPDTAEIHKTYEGWLLFKNGDKTVLRIPFAGYYKAVGVTPPGGTARVTLNIPSTRYTWEMDQGAKNYFQMLLDYTHTAYGSVFTEESMLLDWPELYDAFTAAVPENADLDTGVPAYESRSTDIPAGVYDFLSLGFFGEYDTEWGHTDGTIEGYGIGDDFVFEAGLNYIFTIAYIDYRTVMTLRIEALEPTAIGDVSVYVPNPHYNRSPKTDVTDLNGTYRFGGTASWTPEVSSAFASDTAYAAHITLTANHNFYFDEAVPVNLPYADRIENRTLSEDKTTLEFDAVYPKTVNAGGPKAGIILSDKTGSIPASYCLMLDSSGTSSNKLNNLQFVSFSDDFDFSLPKDFINNPGPYGMMNGGYAYQEVPAGDYDLMLFLYGQYMGFSAQIAGYGNITLEEGQTWVVELTNKYPGKQDIRPDEVLVAIRPLAPAASSVKCNPELLGKDGGAAQITYNGEFLPKPSEVGVFLDGVQVTDPWATGLVTSFSDFSRQRVYLDFPENKSGTPLLYEVRLSDRAGGWLDGAASITVSDQAVAQTPTARMAIRAETMGYRANGLQLLLDSKNTFGLTGVYNTHDADYFVPRDMDMNQNIYVGLNEEAENTIPAGTYSALLGWASGGSIQIIQHYINVEIEAGRSYRFVEYQKPNYSNARRLEIDGVVQPDSIAVPLEAPQALEAPQTTVSGSGYTGTVSWMPADAAFARGTAYTAHVELTAEPGSGINYSFLNRVDYYGDLDTSFLSVPDKKQISNCVATKDKISFDVEYNQTVGAEGDYAKVVLKVGDLTIEGNGYYMGLDPTCTNLIPGQENPNVYAFAHTLPLNCQQDYFKGNTVRENESRSALFPAGKYDILATPSDTSLLDWSSGYPFYMAHEFALDAGAAYEFIFSDDLCKAELVKHEPVGITALSAGGGTVSLDSPYKTPDGKVIWGEKVYLTATPDDGCQFFGWYEGDTLVSEDASCSFTALADRTLEARFSGGSADQPVITGIAVTTPSIVETLAANLRVSVTGKNLAGQAMTAYLLVDGALLYPTDISSGSALMRVPAAPRAGTDCRVVVKVTGSDAEGSFAMTLLVYNPETLWSPALVVSEDGFLAVRFAEDIGPGKNGYAAAISDVTCGVAQSGRTLVTNALARDVAPASTVKISGVKYPALFPSYSFTFTLKTAP